MEESGKDEQAMHEATLSLYNEYHNEYFNLPFIVKIAINVWLLEYQIID